MAGEGRLKLDNDEAYADPNGPAALFQRGESKAATFRWERGTSLLEASESQG